MITASLVFLIGVGTNVFSASWRIGLLAIAVEAGAAASISLEDWSPDRPEAWMRLVDALVRTLVAPAFLWWAFLRTEKTRTVDMFPTSATRWTSCVAACAAGVGTGHLVGAIDPTTPWLSFGAAAAAALVSLVVLSTSWRFSETLLGVLTLENGALLLEAAAPFPVSPRVQVGTAVAFALSVIVMVVLLFRMHAIEDEPLVPSTTASSAGGA